MIEKMKFVNIMGPIDDIERVKEQYLINCDIQIEDAVMELASDKNVSSFVAINPYIDILRKAEQYANLADIECAPESHLSTEDALLVVENIECLFEESADKINEITMKKNHFEDTVRKIKPFIDLEFPIEKLTSFNFIKYRFGKIPISSYKQFETYMLDKDGMLLEKSSIDNDYVYCVYFVPESLNERVSAIFSSLHFEEITIPTELTGTPYDAYNDLTKEIRECEDSIKDIEAEQACALVNYRGDLSYAMRKLKELSGYAELQKFAAKTKDDFYIIVGWMAERDAKKLEKRCESDEKVVVILEDTINEIKTSPPTKLKNPAAFKPFEYLIKMYGLPKYNEIDPTVFFGLSYSILFGLMFGDLGQGLVLSLIGYGLFRFYNVALGSVLAIIGLFSAFFGLMYGSVFGYENLIPSFWISPMHDINLVLLITVIFGIVLNMTAMSFHIINAVKSKELGKALFDSNGLSGLVFYSAILVAFVSAYTGSYTLTTGVIFVFIVIPLLLIMFREPLTNILKRNKRLIGGRKSDFIMELVFETLEVLLAYITNTISFVRVGAFALCHVGMMTVVLMLAGASETNMGNPLVMIFGNIFVMCMEGLVVGIQALRLQFYEMFSRYFEGGGREFKSFKNQYKL